MKQWRSVKRQLSAIRLGMNLYLIFTKHIKYHQKLTWQQYFQKALKCDAYMFEAFDRLTSHHMMRAEEEEELLEAIPLAEHCGCGEEQRLLQFLYRSMLKKVS